MSDLHEKCEQCEKLVEGCFLARSVKFVCLECYNAQFAELKAQLAEAESTMRRLSLFIRRDIGDLLDHIVHELDCDCPVRTADDAADQECVYCHATAIGAKRDKLPLSQNTRKESTNVKPDGNPVEADPEA